MKKILCFGDSNTWGHNPVDCSKLEKPWTVWLKDIVPEYEIVSDGVCGRATTHYLENEDKTNGLKDFRERYLSGENDFDLIIIMLGTNDVLNNIDFSNLSDSEFDNPLGSGASVVFGASGGVMEAALRTLVEVIDKKELVF